MKTGDETETELRFRSAERKGERKGELSGRNTNGKGAEGGRRRPSLGRSEGASKLNGSSPIGGTAPRGDDGEGEGCARFHWATGCLCEGECPSQRWLKESSRDCYPSVQRATDLGYPLDMRSLSGVISWTPLIVENTAGVGYRNLRVGEGVPFLFFFDKLCGVV